ncbi:hypothetical protein D3C81_238360 [compost metagenome]
MQHAHGFGGTHHFAGQALDLGDGFVDHFVAFTGFAVRRRSGLRGFFGVARDFLHGGGHLVHGGGDLIGFHLLIVDPGAGLFGDGRQFFGGAGDLGDAVADAADQVAQGHAHARNALLQHAEFIAACDLDVLGQVAAGDTFDHGQGVAQRAGDLSGDEHGGNDAHEQCQQRADQLQGAGLVAFGVTAVKLDLIQLLAQADDGRALVGHFLA